MNDKSKYWIDTAHYDIDSAKVMLSGKRYLYVGFLCHLTIEKALKAVIAADEAVTPPKIHNLLKLSNMTDVYTSMSEQQKQFLSELNPLNIESRYPAYKEEVSAALNETNCKAIIEETEALLCWIKLRL